jgi:hypothetical protein
MRWEKTQISKIRNEKGEITTNTKEIQGIICSSTTKVLSYQNKNVVSLKNLDNEYNCARLLCSMNKHNLGMN